MGFLGLPGRGRALRDEGRAAVAGGAAAGERQRAVRRGRRRARGPAAGPVVARRYGNRVADCVRVGLRS